MYSKIKICVKDTNKMSSSVDISNFDFDNNDTVVNDTSINEVTMNYMVNNGCFFTSVAGVFQGESLSPFLFTMFVNDLSENLKSLDGVGVKFDEWLLTLLMFADDMVIFSLTRSGLQNGLNLLETYCSRWRLVVKVNKTKCLAFRNGAENRSLRQVDLYG